MMERHSKRWRPVLVNFLAYALFTAFSFGFWYLLFVAVAP